MCYLLLKLQAYEAKLHLLLQHDLSYVSSTSLDQNLQACDLMP